MLIVLECTDLKQPCSTKPKTLTEVEFAREMTFIQLIHEAEGRLDGAMGSLHFEQS